MQERMSRVAVGQSQRLVVTVWGPLPLLRVYNQHRIKKEMEQPVSFLLVILDMLQYRPYPSYGASLVRVLVVWKPALL